MSKEEDIDAFRPLLAARQGPGGHSNATDTIDSEVDPSIGDAERDEGTALLLTGRAPWGSARSLLTTDRQARICEAIRSGASRRSAAGSAGVTYWTFNDWVKKGRRDLALGRFESDYVRLLEAVEKAEADSEAVMVGVVRAAARGGVVEVPVLDVLRRPVLTPDGKLVTEQVYERPNWQAASWVLERRFSEDWGRKSDVTMHEGDARSGLSDMVVDRLRIALKPADE